MRETGPDGKRRSEAVFILLIGSLYVYALSASVIAATVIAVHPTRVFVTGLAALLICLGACYNRRTMLTALGLLAAAGLWIGLGRAAGQDAGAHLVGVMQFIGGYVVDPETYGRTVEWLLCLAAGMTAALFLYKRFTFYVLALTGAAPYALGAVMGYAQNRAAFFVFLFVLCALMVRRFNPAPHAALTALLTLPLCALAVAGAAALPAHRAYTPNAVKTLLEQPLNRVYDFVYGIFNPLYFSFQTTGFNRAGGRMGGPVILNNRAVMAVDAPERVYLSGLTKNAYDGASWTDTVQAGDLATDGLAPGAFEMAETAAALVTRPPLQEVYIGVENRTGTIFRPGKSSGLAFLTEARAYTVTPSGDLLADTPLPRYTGYSFDYLPQDAQSNAVRDILRQAGQGAYDPEGFTPGTEGEGFTPGTLAAYAASVRAVYTALPDALPGRVYDLAASLTEDAPTDYDKALAIRDYLTRLPYTLNPPPVPADADFADFFLFEASEGYCTYYATAMAVLSRCVGLPARYVEGYLTPPAADGGWRVVTNAHAHAWAEVYLEGYGWLVMEATAPFAAERRPAGSGGMFAASFMGYSSYEEYLRSIGVDLNAAPAAYFWPEEIAETIENPVRPGFWVQFVGSSALMAALAALGFLYIGLQRARERLRWLRVTRMAPNQQAQRYFKGVLRMTNYMSNHYHTPLRDNETPQAYALRLGKRFAFKSDSAVLRDVAALYYKARYGVSPLTDQELALMRVAYTDMFTLLKNVRSAPRFMFIRYVRRVTRL